MADAGFELLIARFIYEKERCVSFIGDLALDVFIFGWLCSV
jgi:hypothetical protein